VNWEAIGSIAELIGALAVLATLIYLALQIRQNTKGMEETRKVELARNRTLTTQLRTDWLLSEATSKEMHPMYNKLYTAGFPKEPKSLQVLTAEEKIQLGFFQVVNRMINENAKYQYDMGLIDEESYESSRLVLQNMRLIWDELGISEGSLLVDKDP